MKNILNDTEQGFLNDRAILFYFDKHLYYSAGNEGRLFTEEELIVLKNKVEATLDFYRDNNVSNESINERNIQASDEYYNIELINSGSSKTVKEQKQGYIYLMKNTFTNDLKIGFSVSPESRLKQLNTASANKIELMYSFPGTFTDEKQLHNYFAAARLSSEWFKNDPLIINYFKGKVL